MSGRDQLGHQLLPHSIALSPVPAVPLQGVGNAVNFCWYWGKDILCALGAVQMTNVLSFLLCEGDKPFHPL